MQTLNPSYYNRIVVWRASLGTRHEKDLVPKTNMLTMLIIEKYVRDIIWGQNFAPGLLESMLEPSRLVKEELWRILINMGQFRSKIQKFWVSTFQMSGKIEDFRRRLPAGAKSDETNICLT